VSAAGAITTSVGVFDALSARLAERAGFDVLFLSGFGVSASLLGQPDFGLLTQSEVLDAARRVVRAVRVPVIVDGDTGHGGVANVQLLVRELVAMGARGVLLEDQVWPKRCGHMAGKAVVPMEEHVAKLRAAAEARGAAPFWILGRTDARATHGLDEAIRRARAYREAGADILFVEAPETREELARIGRELPGPLIANMVEGGRTPILRPEELRALGFEWVVYPITALLAAARAMESAYAALRAKGTSEASGPMMAFEELTDLLGLPELRALEERLRS
jgi:2-methylisocitrate lyase-like PEP mutase family enzyme